ncbi:MAG TPA: sigma-70 family RNA polymerase sigma factor [Gemmataceae bacterium]|nr:sigma-70 family RNA polymerase sigma factor [Gemmataceae bacterium]
MGPPQGNDFDRFRPYLLLLAGAHLNARLRGRVGASDVVQQTLLEAHRDREQYRGQTTAELAGWLRQILVRNLLDARKEHGRERRDVRRDVALAAELGRSSAQLAGWLADPGPSPSQAAARDEQAVRMAGALADLPEAQREALVLQHWHGWTLARIGQQLDRSPEAVAGLLKRGLKRLRELLDDAD